MGSVTVQIIGDGTVGTKSKTFTFTNAQINRLVTFGSYIYKQKNPGTTPNVTQSLSAWGDWIIEHTKSKLRETEERVAREAVPPPDSFDPT